MVWLRVRELGGHGYVGIRRVSWSGLVKPRVSWRWAGGWCTPFFRFEANIVKVFDDLAVVQLRWGVEVKLPSSTRSGYFICGLTGASFQAHLKKSRNVHDCILDFCGDLLNWIWSTEPLLRWHFLSFCFLRTRIRPTFLVKFIYESERGPD